MPFVVDFEQVFTHSDSWFLADLGQYLFIFNMTSLTTKYDVLVSLDSQLFDKYAQCNIKQKLFLQTNFMLRYFNFEPNFKLRWCLARHLFGSQNSIDLNRVWNSNLFHTKYLPDSLGHKASYIEGCVRYIFARLF